MNAHQELKYLHVAGAQGDMKEFATFCRLHTDVFNVLAIRRAIAVSVLENVLCLMWTCLDRILTKIKKSVVVAAGTFARVFLAQG